MADFVGNVYRPSDGLVDRDYFSAADVAIAEINPRVLNLRVGKLLYNKVSSAPAHPNYLQSGDGAYWELDESISALSAGATLEARTRAIMFEDFIGTWAIGDAGPADLFSSTAGGGTGNEVATTVAGSVNGEITLKSASDDGDHAANATLLTGINLGYLAEKGGLAIEARLKLDAITAVALFVGFTDAISTTVELPIFLATDTGANVLDSDATDACGIIFDTDAVTDQWAHGGVKDDVDTAPAFSGSAPVADTYVTLRVEVSALGAVRGFIDGVPIGPAVANAVTPDVPLTWAIAIANRGAAQRIPTIDWISVEQNR